MHKSDKIHAHTIMMHSVQALYCNWDCHWDCLRILGYPQMTQMDVRRRTLWENKVWLMMIDEWWLMNDEWWLMIDEWWMMTDYWWFVWLIVINDVSFDKIGCISTNQKKAFLFGFVFDLNKNLTLKKDNSFSFSLLNRFFALYLHKISCISAKQSSKLVDSALDLHYLWIR